MNTATRGWTTLALWLTVATACGVTVKETASGDAGAAGQAPAATDTPPIRTSDRATTGAVPTDLQGAWTLTALDGAPVPDVGKIPTLEILENGEVSGSSGVNRFRTQLEIIEGRLAFGPTAGTKMAGPPEAMELEDTFLARLGAVSTYQIGGDTLRLWAGDNEALTLTRTGD